MWHALVLLGLSISLTGSAQEGSLRFFVGSWDFHAWFSTDTEGPPDLTAQWTLESGLDSAVALTGHVVIDGVTFTRELITYDPFTRNYSRTITANNGSHFVFTSSGWDGDHLLWVGTQHSATGRIELKEEIERTGRDSFRAVFYRRSGERWEFQQTESLERKRP